MTTSEPSKLDEPQAATDYDADHFSRTTLILSRQAADAVQGRRTHRRFRTRIVAGESTCLTRTGQAALVTAVATAVRAFNEVTVSLSVPHAVIMGGPHVGLELASLLLAEGAHPVEDSGPIPDRVIVIGEVPAGVDPRPHWVRASWTGWTASVGPVDGPGSAAGAVFDPDAGLDSANVLAAIGAGALAVAEVFFAFMTGRPLGTARRVRLNLWAPGSQIDGPALTYAPSQWWLLGLGHLGQGYAHVISWLDYADPSLVEVVLQDTQRAVPANHSTGVLTPADPHNQRKTRIVADALDRCGLDTVIIDRRMAAHAPVTSDDMHVALIGVDNLPTRRLIDKFGWKTAIDVGLGAGVRDFDGMTVRRFPGQPSDTVPAWQDRPVATASDHPGVQAPMLDACGLAELDGVAVGASFVGVIAGAVAVSEATRVLHGGNAFAVICHDLREDEVDAAATGTFDPPVAAQLRQQIR